MRPRFLCISVSASAAFASAFAMANPPGIVRCWGSNSYGQSVPPTGLGLVTQVSAGGQHTLALKANGQVAAWGYNEFGQCTVPGGLGGVAAVEAGDIHSVALRTDGSVVCWGDNSYGQCNSPELSGVVQICAQSQRTVVLLGDGTVRCWGRNDYGSCNVPAGLGDVAQLSISGWENYALKSDGTVVSWPQGWATGVGGLGTVAISVGGGHFITRDDQGRLQCFWPAPPQYGQCNMPNLLPVVQVDTGSGFTVALEVGGAVRAWGTNFSGESTVPTDIANVVSISAGDRHAAVIMADPCPGDLFDDQQVNGADLGILLSQWGIANANIGSDINHDGQVDGSDLGLLLSQWGPCPN